MSISKTTQRLYGNHHERRLTSKISSRNTDLELGHIIKTMLNTLEMNSKENMDDKTCLQFSKMIKTMMRMADQIMLQVK